MEKSGFWEVSKELKIQHHRDDVDRLSDLPDHVLSRVLSLLPIWSAIATTTLSKRWKNVWTGIGTLDLTDISARLKSNKDYTSFRDFLDKLLLCKDISCWHLVKFYLSGDIDRIHASKWITSMMQCGIRKLVLKEESDNLMLLSASFFTSHELVELELSGDLHISFPVSLHFPSLKAVCLENVRFLDGTSLTNLVFGCPILEELTIEDCKGEGNMDLYSRSLKKLWIGDLYWSIENVITINGPTLQDLLLDVSCSCVASAPDLRYLFVSALCGSNFRLEDMPLLVDAFLSMDCGGKKALETLHNVRGVESLTLGDISMIGNNGQGLPVFSNLTSLDITMSNWPILVHILELSPNLEYLVADFANNYRKLEWSCPTRVPDCILTLQGFRINGFDGDTFMLELIRYIFWNAEFLEEMIVKVSCTFQQAFSDAGDFGLIERITEIMDMAYKASCDCEITVL